MNGVDDFTCPVVGFLTNGANVWVILEDTQPPQHYWRELPIMTYILPHDLHLSRRRLLALARWYLVILLLLGTSISTRFCIPGKCGLCCSVVCFAGLSAQRMPCPGARRILVLRMPVLVIF